MQGHGSRGDTELVHQIGVGNIGVSQRFDGWVFQTHDQHIKLTEHLLDIALRGWQERCQIFRCRVDGRDLLDDDLHLSLVRLGLPFDPDKAVGGQLAEKFFGCVPHSPRRTACGVLEQTLEERLTGTGLAELTVLDGIGAVDELVGAERFDVDMLCHVSIVPMTVRVAK